MHFIHHQYSCGGGSDRKSMENRAQFDVFGPKHARVRFSAHHAKLQKPKDARGAPRNSYNKLSDLASEPHFALCENTCG
jgi:hypothetical protein